jgi:uncharacterized damage-inducible protein DinB
MRTFSQLVLEFVGMATPTLVGITTRTWPEGGTTEAPTTKEEMIQLWDKTTSEIDRLWPEIPPDRFQETDKAFGQWEMPVYGLISYIIDNEIHHRGQGYVYLRSLGVEPPPFYVRE